MTAENRCRWTFTILLTVLGVLLVGRSASAATVTVSHIGLNASIKPVAQSEVIRFSGTVWAASHGERRLVYLAFAKAGSAGYVAKGSVWSSATNGTYALTSPAVASGIWRASVAASTTRTAAHAYAVVQVLSPVVITKGGVYSGSWYSGSADVPAVSVATSEPVTIVNSTISSHGALIRSAVVRTRITVRNTTGTALHPDVIGRAPGKFVTVEWASALDIENTTMIGTGGIYISHPEPGMYVRVLRNRALNIDGRLSTGTGYSPTAYAIACFVQLNTVPAADVEIAWNEVINTPGQSRPEDNINIFSSSGTETNPIRIHDNYIQGAYPGDPTAATYFGGGIMADGDANTGWLSVTDNQVVATTNYGLGIAAGHDVTYTRNTVVIAGTLADGTPLKATNIGAYVWNFYSTSIFTNNRMEDNAIALWRPASAIRADWWLPGCTGTCQNISLYGSRAVTTADEQVELVRWHSKILQVRVGNV